MHKISFQSSLLKCILGEVPVSSGSVKVGGTVSYAAQEPWVFSGSIRQNVLFGLPFEEEREVECMQKQYTLGEIRIRYDVLKILANFWF